MPVVLVEKLLPGGQRLGRLAGLALMAYSTTGVQFALATGLLIGLAVAAQKQGLLPLTQHAMRFTGRLAYHDYEGVALRDVALAMAPTGSSVRPFPRPRSPP